MRQRSFHPLLLIQSRKLRDSALLKSGCPRSRNAHHLIHVLGPPAIRHVCRMLALPETMHSDIQATACDKRRMCCHNELDTWKQRSQLRKNRPLPAWMQMLLDFVDDNDTGKVGGIKSVRRLVVIEEPP